MSATIYSLIKIVEKKSYAEDFVAGKLYMNPIWQFREYKDENGELRGDPYEGLMGWYQPKDGLQVTIGDVTIPVEDIAEPIAIQSNSVLNMNAFCMYTMNSKGFSTVSADMLQDFKKTLTIHEHCFGLGNICISITHVTQFLDRVNSAIRSARINGRHGMVEYFDEKTFHGNFDSKLPGFHKRSIYSVQKEFRIIVEKYEKKAKPFVLEVGDLSDIAIMSTPEEFNRKLRIELPDGSVA